MIMEEDVEYAIKLQRGTGIEKGFDGVIKGNMLASYAHFHAASYREFPKHFIKIAKDEKGVLSEK